MKTLYNIFNIFKMIYDVLFKDALLKRHLKFIILSRFSGMQKPFVYRNPVTEKIYAILVLCYHKVFKNKIYTGLLSMCLLFVRNIRARVSFIFGILNSLLFKGLRRDHLCILPLSAIKPLFFDKEVSDGLIKEVLEHLISGLERGESLHEIIEFLVGEGCDAVSEESIKETLMLFAENLADIRTTFNAEISAGLINDFLKLYFWDDMPQEVIFIEWYHILGGLIAFGIVSYCVYRVYKAYSVESPVNDPSISDESSSDILFSTYEFESYFYIIPSIIVLLFFIRFLFYFKNYFRYP